MNEKSKRASKPTDTMPPRGKVNEGKLCYYYKLEFNFTIVGNFKHTSSETGN